MLKDKSLLLPNPQKGFEMPGLIITLVVIVVFATLGYIAQEWSVYGGFIALIVLVVVMVALHGTIMNAFYFICPISAVLAFGIANRLALRPRMSRTPKAGR